MLAQRVQIPTHVCDLGPVLLVQARVSVACLRFDLTNQLLHHPLVVRVTLSEAFFNKRTKLCFGLGADALLHLFEGVLDLGIVLWLLVVVDDVELGARFLLLKVFRCLLGLSLGFELGLGHNSF